MTKSALESDLPNIQQARTITILFGWMLMVWNKTEGQIKEIAACIIGNGDWVAQSRAKMVVAEMGAIGLSQAINSISHEFPPEQQDFADALRRATRIYDCLRDYRNYLAHGLHDISQYGVLPTAEQWSSGALITEVMKEGPFAYILGHTAKSESKLVMDFLNEQEMRTLSEEFERFYEFLRELERYARYITSISGPNNRRRRPRKSAPQLPPLPPMPKKLQRRAYGRREGIGRYAPRPHGIEE